MCVTYRTWWLCRYYNTTFQSCPCQSDADTDTDTGTQITTMTTTYAYTLVLTVPATATVPSTNKNAPHDFYTLPDSYYLHLFCDPFPLIQVHQTNDWNTAQPIQRRYSRDPTRNDDTARGGYKNGHIVHVSSLEQVSECCLFAWVFCTCYLSFVVIFSLNIRALRLFLDHCAQLVQDVVWHPQRFLLSSPAYCIFSAVFPLICNFFFLCLSKGWKGSVWMFMCTELATAWVGHIPRHQKRQRK